MLVEVAVAAFAAALFYFLFTRRPVCHGGTKPGERRPPIQVLLDNPEMIQYELKNLEVAVVSGRMLQFLAWLSFTRFSQYMLLPILKNGIDRMGGIYLPEKPTLYPTPPTPPDMKDYSQPNEKIIRRMLDQQIEQKTSERGFRFPTVADYIQAYKSGACTPTDIAEAVLKAITDSNKADPPLHAIVDTSRDVVLAMAEASTQRWKTGKNISVLDGIPVAMKGTFRVEPYVLRCGTTFVPEIGSCTPNSVIAQKLKDGGAIIIGVTNVPEFCADPIGSNTNNQTSPNPYNPQCYAGGSSTGSAVSVAAGLCPLAIGADGGGSIRNPASQCGIVGVKATHGVIDNIGLPLAYSISAPGPLCSSVLDTAIALDAISRETEGDEKRLSLEGLGETSLEGTTIGVYWEFFEHADKEIVQKCKLAVNQLQSLGATIVEIKIPELEESRVAQVVTAVSEMTSAIANQVDKHYDELKPQTRFFASLGSQFTAVEYINAQKQRTRAIESLKHIFHKVDAIVSPAIACVSPKINEGDMSYGRLDSVITGKLIRFTFLVSLTGNPALVLPVGYTSDGLPIGLQLMGRWYEERVLLRVAWALENSGAFPLQKPQVFYDLIEMAELSHR